MKKTFTDKAKILKGGGGDTSTSTIRIEQEAMKSLGWQQGDDIYCRQTINIGQRILTIEIVLYEEFEKLN